VLPLLPWVVGQALVAAEYQSSREAHVVQKPSQKSRGRCRWTDYATGPLRVTPDAPSSETIAFPSRDARLELHGRVNDRGDAAIVQSRPTAHVRASFSFVPLGVVGFSGFDGETQSTAGG
jgi:hypothetical protein